MLGLNDDAKDTDILDNIKALTDTQKQTIDFLKMHDVDSFEALDRKMIEESTKTALEIQELKTSILRDKVESLVTKALNDSVLMECSKPAMISLGMKDFDAFKEMLNALPKKVMKFDESVLKDDSKALTDGAVLETPKHKTLGHNEIEAARLFGVKVSDVDAWNQ
jgi:hypothetical protein